VPDDDQPDDASLSEFVPDDRTDATHDEDDPDPAVSTSDYRAGGADCKGCGATVERRWRDDGALVCADCKSW
jgi:hypothetical protein